MISNVTSIEITKKNGKLIWLRKVSFQDDKDSIPVTFFEPLGACIEDQET